MRMNNERKHTGRIQIGFLGIAVILCVLLVVLCTATYAVFTSVRSVQRTIAAYDTEGDRFSSNFLLKGNSRDNIRTVYTTGTTLPAVSVVTICNYQQGRQTLPFPDPITYTLTARLVKYDESNVEKYVPVNAAYLTSESLTGYTVTVSCDGVTKTLGVSNLSDSFTASFTGGVSDSDAYTVSFCTDFAVNEPNLYLEMIATPTSGLLPTLRGVFKPDLRASGATDYWTGEFRDDSNIAPSQYDGYNYLVTGAGSGTATVAWNSSKVVISDVSRDLLLSITGATQDGNSITFPVDSDIESRYDLQFYKVNITTETWSQMAETAVTFNFS
ncbi:MAG: hypothetical protein J5662_00500 [Clostridia bacterium]|nr:hypothetical protein [Clostridia bacterium]